jgi:hypothetical protein
VQGEVIVRARVQITKRLKVNVVDGGRTVTRPEIVLQNEVRETEFEVGKSKVNFSGEW